MSEFYEKQYQLSIVFKLPQSGKTGIIEDMIHDSEEKLLDESFFDAEEEEKLLYNIDLVSNTNENTANIIITGNSLILSNQTKERLDLYMSGKIYEMSSNKFSISNIIENIATKDENSLPKCRHIVCCSNNIQFKNIKKLIDIYFSNNLDVCIYADEIDKYWSQLKSLLLYYKDDTRLKIYGFTATLNDKMFKDQENCLNFIHQDIDHGPNYVMYKNHDINIIDTCQSNEELLEKILDESVDENESVNILIIPGRTNSEHNELAKVCLSMNVKPIVINQHGIRLFKSSRKIISLDDEYCRTVQLQDILKEVRDKYKIVTPIAVIASTTCAGRGVTHQSENFIYDIGIILRSYYNKAEVFQSVSRLAHNYKNLIEKSCKLFISDKNDNTCKNEESRILAINRICKEKTVISLSEYKKAGYKLCYNTTAPFDDKDLLKNYLKNHKHKEGITEFRIYDDKYIKYRGEKIEIKEYINKNIFDVQDIHWGFNNKTPARIMPVKHDGIIKWVGIYIT